MGTIIGKAKLGENVKKPEPKPEPKKGEPKEKGERKDKE